MDLSRLSDEDLQALQAGDMSKVSSGALAYLAGQAKPTPKTETTGSYVGDVVSNLLPSAKRYGEGIVNAVIHPLDTARSVIDMGAGALQNALPESLVQFIGEDKPSRQLAADVGHGLTQRYGGLGNAAETFRTDPVGVAGDASMLLSGGAGLAKVATLPRTAGVLGTAAKLTNPVNLVNNPVTRSAAAIPTKMIGDVLTGAGAGSLQTAYDATKAGGKSALDYWSNLRGDVPPDEVIDIAHRGVSNLRKEMVDKYRTLKNDPTGQNMGWADDPTPLSFTGVDQAFQDAMNKFSFHGTPQPGVIPVATDIKNVLDDWKLMGRADPAYLSVEGLDALKRHLNAIYPADVANRTGRSFASAVVDGVKNTISQQAPQYRGAMHEYWADSSKLDDITRELSLGPNANTGTTLRKLQAIMRGNAGAGWEYRKSLGETLADAGGDVGPSLAGQALNSWTPRGLAKYADPAMLVTAASTGNLAPALAAAPMTSPRLMGELYGGLGTLARRTGAVKSAIQSAVQPQSMPSLQDLLNATRTRGLDELGQKYQDN
jgi:hypothetical protein